MKTKILFSVFCILSVLANAQTVKMDLFQCIKLASDSSLQAFRAKNMYLSGYWDYRAYKASLLPSISLHVSPLQYNRNITQRYDYTENLDVYREQQSLSSSGGVAVSQSVPLTGGTFSLSSDLSYMRNFGANNYSQYSSVPFRIGYSQTLFGFNSFKWEKKIEPLKFEQAKQRLIYQLEEIAEAAIQYFFDLALAQKEYELAADNVLSTDTLFRVGLEREKIDAIAPSDLQLLELDVIGAENNLKSARLNLKNARYRFRTFLNREEAFESDVTVPIKRFAIAVSDDEALMYAIENNPDYRSFAQELLESERNLEQTEKNASFSASISASIGFNQAAETFTGAYKNPSQQDVVNIGVSIPVVDWGVNKGRISVAKNNRLLAQLSIEQERKNLKQEIVATIDNFNLLQELVVSAEKALLLATSAYENTKRRFIVGKSDVNSLTLTLNRQREAQRNFLETLKGYWLSYYKLRRLTLFDFEKRENLSDEIDAELFCGNYAPCSIN
jgi:outer membrane protein TolC